MKNIYITLFHYKPYLVLFSFVFISMQGFAQSSGRAIIKGKTYDSSSFAPLSFSGIRVFKSREKKLEKESVANEGGDFSVELPYGRYYALIDFMGYKSYKTSEFSVSKEYSTHDLGV